MCGARAAALPRPHALQRGLIVAQAASAAAVNAAGEVAPEGGKGPGLK